MQTKLKTREVDLNGLKIGGDNPPAAICEILTNIAPNYPILLKQAWGDLLSSTLECVKTAVKMGFSGLNIRFNSEDIDESRECLREILKITDLPLILTGTFRRDFDARLLPELARTADRKCTIGAVEEENYKAIAPAVKECGHNIIARTPIDINLTKQLNILLTELGFDPDKILVDPNTGGLGYGLDYAYSIIERIKIAAKDGDAMLNMPIITFVGEEAWKTKEARSDNVPIEWGDFKTRAVSWEAVTASSMLVSGADVVVMRHPEAIKHINKFIENGLF